MSDQRMDIILKDIYPLVEESLNSSSTIRNYNKLIGEFIDDRHDDLYAIAPYSRIYYNQNDIDKLFKVLNLNERNIENMIKETYYSKMRSFNPAAAKDPTTIVGLCIIRYFNKMNKYKRELELSMIYLSFSGKFYPSIHYRSYPTVQPIEYKHVMDYAINNELSDKYDIRREGSVIGAVKSVANTWINTYNGKLKRFKDEDVVYLIQQLHNRIGSFMTNIAEVYYKIYNNKDRYLTYDSDSLDDEDYRLADNDSLKVERYVEAVSNEIVSKSVDVLLVRTAAGNNIKIEELRSILEDVINNPDNLSGIKEVIRLLITEYFRENPYGDLADVKFIANSIKAVPNTKNSNIIKRKEIIEKWLDENSTNYRKRKSRNATRLAYNRAVLTYFALYINKVSKTIR